ncbi:EAL domain-containing protein [Ectothiorhodospiraceae bacterium 2226]|nr:EAL domain-containing protein [Ectothiorhodospiraceae bacterium 2226]
MSKRATVELLDDLLAQGAVDDVARAHLGTALGVAGIGLAEIGPQGRWRRVSRRFCELLGQQPSALAKLTPVEVLWPHEPGTHHLDELLDGRVAKVQTEITLQREAGPVHLSLTLVATGPDRAARPAAIHAVLRDIGERIRAQHAARRTDAELKLLLDGTTAYGILLLDPDGRILRCSKGAAQMLGRSAQSLIGQPAYILFTDEDRASGRLEQELRTARSEGVAADDRWHMRADGTRFWASGAVSPLYDAEGRLRGYSKIMRDLTQARLAQEEAAYLANHDALTGLPNRTQLSNRLHEALARAQRSGDIVALLLLDLDHFKPINDTFGHYTGDLLLKQVAQRLLTQTRETDMVARLGGDEFVVVQTSEGDRRAVESLALKLGAALAEPYDVEGRVLHCTASIGVTLHPADADDPVQMLKNADLALYKAKSDPSRRHAFYTREMNHGSERRRELGERLRRAFEGGQFRVYYQPQIDLEEWKLAGVEALLRWDGPDAPLPYARDFISIAEETGLILPLGEWALETACTQSKAWQRSGLPPIRMSVNMSGRQFVDLRLIERIRAVLDANELDYDCLKLEINERPLTRDARARTAVLKLQEMGVQVALDNYGAGLTSLRALKELRIDQVKLAQSVVRHLPHSPADAAIAAGVIRLANDLDIEVMAEGVETADQLAFLRDQGCRKAQGFLFAPPMLPDDLVLLMRDHGWTRINPPNGTSLHPT